MTMRIGLTLRILARKLVYFLIFLAVCAGLYWCWCNWAWIQYKGQRHYDRAAYGLNWKVDFITACDKARAEAKQVVIAVLDDGEAASEKLKKEIFPVSAFKAVENNFVLVLVDYPKDRSTMTSREKAICDEMWKNYQPKYGDLIVIDPANAASPRELRRIPYRKESAPQLLDLLAGGAFTAKIPVDSTPKLVVFPNPWTQVQNAVPQVEKMTGELVKKATPAATPAVPVKK